MTILITGGAGFIGANFVHYWLDKYPEDQLVVLDALTYAGRRENLGGVLGKIDFIKGDIRDETLVTEIFQDKAVERVVHFAAESHVDRSIEGPDIFVTTNILGTHTLLKAALQFWGEAADPARYRFHHVSTDEVYGSLEPAAAPTTELDRYAPNSPYAASKAGSDHLVRAYGQTYKIPVTISHCSNNFGAYQYEEKLMPLAIHRMVSGESIPIYGTGQNIRDWLYVRDHCYGLELILTQGKMGEVYNIGGGVAWTNLELIETLCDTVDQVLKSTPQYAHHYVNARCFKGGRSRDLISFVNDRKGHDQRYAINCDKANQQLGYAPQHEFASALQSTVEWYLEYFMNV
jgi:dTDP-glucose 4,6-dehydratase